MGDGTGTNGLISFGKRCQITTGGTGKGFRRYLKRTPEINWIKECRERTAIINRQLLLMSFVGMEITDK